MLDKQAFEQLVESIKEGINVDIQVLKQRLFPTTIPGMEKVAQKEYLQFVYDKWGDLNFRNTLLLRVGPKNFLATAKDVLKELGQPSVELPKPEGAQLANLPPSA